MTTVEKLLKITYESVNETKVEDYEIERLSKALKKAGLKGEDAKFKIKIKNLDPDTAYDYSMELLDDNMKIDKEKMSEVSMEVICSGIVEPKYNDPQLINWLGFSEKENILPIQVWGKLFQKMERINIANRILAISSSDKGTELKN